MQDYEYTAIPAPTRAEKNRTLKTPGERFGATIAGVLNRMAAEGWEYLRADVLPSDERSGLTSRTTVFHNLLIFRRSLAQAPAETVLAPRGSDVPRQPRKAPGNYPDLSVHRPNPASRRASAPTPEPGSAPRLGPATTED